MTATLGFALIGCGGMGRSEARLLSQLPNARLVMVCDVQAQAADAFGREMGVPAADPADAVPALPEWSLRGSAAKNGLNRRGPSPAP